MVKLASLHLGILLVVFSVQLTYAHAEEPPMRAEDFHGEVIPRLERNEALTLSGPVVFTLEDSDEVASEEAKNRPPTDTPSSTAEGNSLHVPLHLRPRVRITIDSDTGERLTLQNQRHVSFGTDKLIFKTTTRTYEDFCTTPCHLEVAAGAYRFAVTDGEHWKRGRSIEVPRRVYIDEDSELLLHRKNRRPARATFFSAMAASAVAGIALGIISAIEERDDSLTLSPSRIPLMRGFSAGLLLSGAGFFVGGVLSRDTYEVRTRPARSSTLD